MLGRSPEELSRDRGWRLTVDGIHLNARGADLLQELVERWLGRT
jgi:lysophospholipase L1-like esterase